jgi:hypothetical protein
MPTILSPNAGGSGGTLTLAQLKSRFWEFQNLMYPGTATGGDANSITDTTLIDLVGGEFPLPLVDRQIHMLTGNAAGDYRQVAKVDRQKGTIWSNRAFSATINSTDTYELTGAGIYSGQPLTNVFNTVLRRVRPAQWDQVTIVTNQVQYDVSAYVSTRRDILDVQVRLIDAANLRPYDWRAIWWDANDTGDSTVILTVPAMTNQSTLQLWIRHWEGFTALTGDSDTLNADYGDWVTWEAVYEFSRRRYENTTVDKAEWQARMQRAQKELMTLRQRWIPLEPIVPRPPFPIGGSYSVSHMSS